MLTISQQGQELHALTTPEAEVHLQIAEHQQPSQQCRVLVLPLLLKEETTLPLIQGRQVLQSRPMRGEQVLQHIPDLVVQPVPGAVLQLIKDRHHVQAPVQVIHGRLRHLAVVQAIQDQARLPEAARVTQGQAQDQAIQDQARLPEAAQVTRDQVPVEATQGQARLPEAAQATHGQAQVHEAAQATQDQARLHVAVHHPEDPVVRAGHQVAQDQEAGDKIQITYYFSPKHLSNS
jgi:hypothetical protein